ncbi:S-adenosylmethionine uptake transporter [Rhizobium skierniewicense]|uniref:S-adenosylmethionine uptake transporter n=1 Tax=Rhizobium skierniewicense TaxID=984260 RepID=A0A7W6G4A7_9HYPH|nr:DMT family transporter [Rhizobium skierniewicense]MBB3948695.1 S-adenosylmethionine uptake transporter [Rhizobium skierniewicense]
MAGSLEARPLFGIGLAAMGYSCFALQDALVKWLVESYQVPQILFVRSALIVLITGVLAYRYRHPSILKSKYRGTVVIRAALMLTAWVLFYSSARYLGLAELTTLYFSAPIMVMVLSIFVLKEKVGAGRWIACAVGFVGVVAAANPASSPNWLPATLCIVAGFCWAWSTILIRLVSRSETTLTQMYATSALFGIACALSLPWLWKNPDAQGWLLMIGVGLVSTIGQYLLYEGFRHAPASSLAPVEYTGLIWAFIYGYAIWTEIPAINVFIGAVLIAAASLVLVGWERRSFHESSQRN